MWKVINCKRGQLTDPWLVKFDIKLIGLDRDILNNESGWALVLQAMTPTMLLVLFVKEMKLICK